MGQAGFMRPAAALASQGLRYAVSRRDDTWVTLTSRDLVREEADDPNYPGIPLDSPRRRELQQVLRIRDIRAMRTSAIEMRFHSREEVLAHAPNYPFGLTFWAGEYRRALPLWEDEAAESERQGRIAVAVSNWAQVARCYNALGDFAAARAAYQKGRTAGSRLSVVSLQLIQLLTARDEMWLALDENWERAIASFESSTQTQTPELNWFLAAFRAARARIYAHLGKAEQAVDQLKHLVVRSSVLRDGPPTTPEWRATQPRRCGCLAAPTTSRLSSATFATRSSLLIFAIRCSMRDYRLRACAHSRADTTRPPNGSRSHAPS